MPQATDSNQAFRSDMDWNDIDRKRLAHFQKLGKIRKSNKVIGTGHQRTLDTHTCIRYNDRDTILIRVEPIDNQPINVNGIFADGDNLIELYSGQTTKVNDGQIMFSGYENKVGIFKRFTGN